MERNMTDKIISSFQEIENPDFYHENDLKSWKAKVTNILSRVYGADSKQLDYIKEIKFINFYNIDGPGGGNNGKQCSKLAKELIRGFITDLEIFGLPLQKTKENSGINISLNQNQSININLIWDSVKEELTGKQEKEVKEILNSNDEPEMKKNKVLEKVKSFGIDVASNIIASLLTNPAIYGS